MSDSHLYRTYIIRCWRERAADGAAYDWRFRIRDAESGDERGLFSVEALLAFLEKAFEGDATDEQVRNG